MQAKPTPLSEIEGDRFDKARTLSVNELAFKNPIMGTAFKNKAQNGVIVKKGSFLINRALKKDDKLNTNNKSSAIKKEPAKLNNNTVADNTKIKKVENKSATMVKDDANDLQTKHQI